jgi:predicted RNase H-like HicB family nuclease
MDKKFYIKAVWDDEAGVWVASSEDVPGLSTEAETLELLIKKLKIIIPELLHANDITLPDHPISFHLVSERTEIAAV